MKISKGTGIFIFSVAALAFLRVAFFSTILPLFTNIDEQFHLDLVLRYAQGQWPVHAQETLQPESARLISLYESWEYFHTPDQVPPDLKYPLCAMPLPAAKERYNNSVQWWARWRNIELHSPPIYYLVAGAWWDIGKLLGMRGIFSLLFLRLLAGIFMASLVILTFALCREIIPESTQLTYAFPLLVAFFPQDVFYSINADSLSPLLGTAVLLLLVAWMKENNSMGKSFFLGLMTGATLLIKSTNLPIVLGVSAAIFLFLWPLDNRQKVIRLLVICSGILLPLSLWFGWNWVHIGELTGDAEKTKLLGWSLQKIPQILQHPFFRFSGWGIFLRDLTVRFWRGEIFWHGKILASSAADLVFLISTAVFLPMGMIRIGKGNKFSWDESGKNILIIKRTMAMTSVIAVLMLSFISVIFDYGTCFYPSHQYPFLTSGRLISGVLVPFLLVWVSGLESFLKACRLPQYTLLVTIIFCLFITGLEMKLYIPVMNSQFNFFHLILNGCQ